MQVEVVLTQVREHERVEADAVEPPQGRSVRARLDRRAPIAGVEHLAEQPLQVYRLGRGERCGTMLEPDLPFHGPHEARLATRGVQDRPQQERRRRLPVRPGDPRELQLLRRLTEERVGGDRHRLPRRRDE